MKTARFVAGSVLQWLWLTLLGVGFLIWLANTIELSGRLPSDAAWVGLLQTPGLLVRLLPLCVLAAVALTVLRMELRGERQALWILGHGAGRTGMTVAVLGLLVGAAGFALQSGAISHLERQAIGGDSSQMDSWVWLDGRLARPGDGLLLSFRDAELDMQETSSVGESLTDAWIELRPALATNQSLLDSQYRLYQLEFQGRVSRVLACALLAFWAWLPLKPGRRNELLEVVAIGLTWALLELILHGLARTGMVPVTLGAWGAVFFVLACATTRFWSGQRVPQSRIQM